MVIIGWLLTACSPLPPPEGDCGTGSWYAMPESWGAVYVSGDAPDGGDGSYGAPFETIGQALDALAGSGGGLIAVAAGYYQETLSLDASHDGVHILGRCSEQTILAGGADPSDIALMRAGSPGVYLSGDADTRVELSGLTITDAPRGGIRVEGGELVGQDIVVAGNYTRGVRVSAAGGVPAELALTDFVIRDQRALNFTVQGMGGAATDGGVLRLRNGLVTRNTLYGLAAIYGGQLIVEQVDITDNQPDGGGAVGAGLVLGEDSTLEVYSSDISGNSFAGIYAFDSDEAVSRMYLKDVTVRDTNPAPHGWRGNGIFAEGAVEIEVEGGRFYENKGASIAKIPLYFSDTEYVLGGDVWIRDSELRQTRGDLKDGSSVGIFVQGEGVLLERVLVEDAQYGILLDGTAGELRDVHVRDIWYDADEDEGGSGIAVYNQFAETDVLVSGSRVERVAGIGIVFSDVDPLDEVGASLRVVDTSVTDGLPFVQSGKGSGGIGVSQVSGDLSLERGWIEGNTLGLLADGYGTLHITDSDFVRNAPGVVAIPGVLGVGLLVSGGVEAVVEETRLADGYYGAVHVLPSVDDPETGPDVTLSDVNISGGRGAPFWPDDVGGYSISDAGVVVGGGTLRAERLTILDNEGGIAVSGDAYLELEGSLLEGIREVELEGELDTSWGDGLNVYQGGSVVVTDTVLRDIDGEGIVLFEDATAELARVDVERSYGMGLEVWEDSVATLEDVAIVNTRREVDSEVAVGIWVNGDAVVEASGLAITDTEGPGAYVFDSSLDCRGCTFRGNTFAGLVAYGSELELSDAVIADNLQDPVIGGGVGILADEERGDPVVVAGNKTRVRLSDSEVSGHPLSGLYLVGAGSYVLEGNRIEGSDGSTRSSTWPRGNAIFAADVPEWDGYHQQGLWIGGNELSQSAGGAVFLDAATAALEDNGYGENTPDVWQQRCAGVEEPQGVEEAPMAWICPTYDEQTEPLEIEIVADVPDVESSPVGR